MLTYLLYAMLGMEPRASYILNKRSIKLAGSQPVVSVYIVSGDCRYSTQAPFTDSLSIATSAPHPLGPLLRLGPLF